MLKLNEKFFSQLQKEIDAGAGTMPSLVDWRKTPIGKHPEDSLMRDVQRLSSNGWWKSSPPIDMSDVKSILARAHRTLDGKAEENVHAGERITAEEVAEGQRDKRQREGTNEEESWREYLGDPRDDARKWLADFSRKVDMNGDARGFFGALRDHIEKKRPGARIEDLDPELVNFCVKQLCSSSEDRREKQ